MTCVASDHGRATVVHVTGEIDLLTAPELGAVLARAISVGRKTVVIDLSSVSFMDSSCVHALLNARALARQVGVLLIVRKPAPPADRVLELCGL